MISRILILGLLVLLAAVIWKARAYRHTALTQMKKVEVISERFTRTDWFEEDNRRWMESGERPDLVFLGASITLRWDPEGKLGDLKVVQRGVGGQWPSHFLLRYKADVLDLKPKAVAIKSCSISFRPGVNEKGTRQALLDMLDMAEAAGIRPVLATCLPVREDGNVVYGADGGKLDGGINARMLPYNDWLRELCADRGYPLIDFYAALADERGFLPPELAVDDIHPNERGYKIMTVTARPVLEAMFAAPSGS